MEALAVQQLYVLLESRGFDLFDIKRTQLVEGLKLVDVRHLPYEEDALEYLA